ncbi:helix-turn-helix domain-containing protein [Streptomyces sp. WAC 01325]|uniref:helix-turn-helix domain-containing protein n=1 Tax=Streptomyces sp. WAC 01325 TaxID=2203202 RepID=UPI0021AF8855|nr:helix-turn-helix domain-containing protein [Streptomyces sp. WAC 01325]
MSKTPPLDREAKRRLAVIRHAEEVTGNVAMNCRYCGISQQAYYIWYRRYQAEGIEGLRTRSKAPKHSPNATHVDVVGKIIYLRQHYHFGPEKIARYLKRYNDATISESGVWRILERLDMGRLPASQRYRRHDRRWKRYEKQLPGHRVQIDVKFIRPSFVDTPGFSRGRNRSSYGSGAGRGDAPAGRGGVHQQRR